MTGLEITLIVLVALWGASAILTRKMSFAAQQPKDYAGTGPQFDIRQSLSGPMQCEGVIFGPFGRVTSRFIAEMNVVWKGNVGVMTERFTYDSGSIQDREWRLTLSNDGTIKAEAPDVIGAGVGRQEGASVRLQYRIKLPDDAGGHVLDTVDWMYLAPNGNIINRSQFRKFGFKVAELVATMRPREAA